ncbi:2'-5' RNA ligase family protein [Paracoccus aminovorans]|uniref:2'-5' RNA ligase family protein n=1 Tax=Paracoccus aminovorans TaxID=34004 RepID=UPI002B25847C|nr:2'-5' RNA ligase family protein [Paracoccus aminovorans]
MFMQKPPPIPPTGPAHKLFFAAVPPAAVAERMAALWQAMGIRARLRRPVLHMTIQMVADAETVDDALAAFLTRPMRDFRFPAFDITLDRVANFGSRAERRRPLVFTTRGQDAAPNALARAIRRRFASTAWPLPRMYVTPHVTAAYGRPLPESARLVPLIHWHVDELVLIDSLQGLTTHVPLARWPLG